MQFKLHATFRWEENQKNMMEESKQQDKGPMEILILQNKRFIHILCA